MKILNTYNDYELELLVESIKSDTTIFVMSELLEVLITKISHPIAKELLSLQYKRYQEDDNYKITLLDVNNKTDEKGVKQLDSISFINSNKIVDIISKESDLQITNSKSLTQKQKDNINRAIINTDKYFKYKGRSETKLGKIVKKIFANQFKDHEIGEFVEMYKALNIKTTNFDLVSGEDIIYWYNENQYSFGDGPLNNSCMKYDRCGDYISFYAKNDDKVSLLVLKDSKDDTKIIGRALVWKIDILDGEKVENRYFMDRIYYTKEYIKNLFINYAKEQGWLYKKHQNMEEDTPIIDTKNDMFYGNITIHDIIDTEIYPYLDTLKYLTDDNTLTNNKNLINGIFQELVGTWGEAEEMGEYSDYYGRWIDIENDNYYYCEWIDDYRYYSDRYYSDFYDTDIPYDYIEDNMKHCGKFCKSDDYDGNRLNEDCYYSRYYKSYVCTSYATDEMIICEYRDEDDDDDIFRKEEDCVETTNDKTATKEYAQEHFKYNKKTNLYLMNGVWSEYHKDNIDKDDAILVKIKGFDKTDWRLNNDNSWIYDEKTHKYLSK